MEMIKIDGGSVWIQNGEVKCCLEVKSFMMSKFLVTQGLWCEINGEFPGEFNAFDSPAVGLSWYEVQIFIEKLSEKVKISYRLPSEIEWEYACKGGNKSRGFKYSGSNNLDEVGWFSGNSQNVVHPVGLKQPNELGLYDMSGNVFEWVSDVFTTSGTDPNGKVQANNRAIRGGAFNSSMNECASDIRTMIKPNYSHYSVGFRLARDI